MSSEVDDVRRELINHLSMERQALTNDIALCSKGVKLLSDRMVLLDRRDRILRAKIEKLKAKLEE